MSKKVLENENFHKKEVTGEKIWKKKWKLEEQK